MTSRRRGRLDTACVVFLTAVVVLGSVGVFVSVAPASAAETLVVDADGGTPYKTIGSALGASSAGDTVEVRPGVYEETVVVSTAVTLVAPDGATLNGSAFGPTSTGITVDRTLGSGLTIDGFTVEGYGDGIGVGASADEDSPGYHYDDYDEENVTGGWVIRDVVVRDNAEDGIDVGPAVGGAWTIQNVTAIENGDDGIEAGGFGGSVPWRIVESNASLNRDVGIVAGLSSGDWEILDSTTTGNFDGLGMGVYILSRDSDWTIGNHTASGNSFYGIDVAGSFSGEWTIHNSTLTGNSGSGLNANDVETDWVVRDTSLSENYDWGLRASNTPDSWRLENVTVRGNSMGGIAAARTTGQWRIENSTVENNGDYRGWFGIYARYTDEVWSIDNSTITANENGGIDAEGGDGADARGNWWGQASGPLPGQCVGNVNCSSPLTSPPGTDAPPAVVEGRVTNSDGDLLPNIAVTVHRDDGTGTFTGFETTTTDATGQYRVEVGVPSGETSVAFKVEFADPDGAYASEWYDDVATDSEASVLDVQSGFTGFADAELATNTATIHGTVRNESGDPLEGILVVPYREDAGGDLRQLPSITTNESGQYTYEIDVPSGQTGATVKALFVDPDDVYASRYYDDAETLADGVEVYIPAGERRLVSETLPREDDVTAGFSGTVTDESGTPLSGIDVTVFRDAGTGTVREWTTEPTDAQGRYDISVRPPDPDNALVRVKLRFQDPSGQYTELWYDGASESTADDVAGLVSAELGDLNATLVDDAPPAADVARVSGWVTNESGAPLDGLLVVPYATDETGAFRQLPSVGTDANGRYTADLDVPAGETRTDVKLLFVDPDDVYASRYYDDTLTLADATAVTVPGGETRFVSESLPVEREVTATVAGTVTNESGAALSDIEVTVFREDESGNFREYTTELTDANGEYDINVRPADSGDGRVVVKLRFTDPDWEYAQEWNSTSYRNVRTMADAAEVDALVGGTRVRNEVLERNVVTVAGRVRNLDRDSLDGILVVPYREEADGEFESVQSATTYTDEFGRYETDVPVRDGETTVDLKVGFFDPDDEYASLYWPNNTSVADAEVITAEAGWELPNVRVDLPRRDDVAVTYLGSVLDENDEVLEDVLVTVFRDDGTGTFREWTNVRTDENGYWETAVYPPEGESSVAAKIRYRDESGSYVEEWELNESSKATADVKNGTVGDTFFLYGTRLATAPTTQVSGVVREDTWGGGPLDGIRVTVYRDDGTGNFHPFETTTTDDAGYYEFQVPPPPGSSTVSTRLYFRDPAGEYAATWYRDALRSTGSTTLQNPAGEGNYFNDQWLPRAGMLLDVSVQALSTCPDPTDEGSCTFPGDADSVTVGPEEEVAVRYDLWNRDDEAYTDYDVDDPATGTTMFGANQRVATLTNRTATTTLTSPVVDGSYDYRVNATSVSESGRVSNSSATYTVSVEGSVVQRARVGNRFDASVSNAGAGTPVLVDGGDGGLASTSNSTFQSTLLTTDGGNFTLNFTGSDDAPGGTEALSLSSGLALSYLTVDHSIDDENVDEVVFRFRVSRAGLAAAGLSTGDVTLYRYVDGSPTALPTSFVRSTPTAYVFEATSPGLSVFAVGAGEVATAEDQTDAPDDGNGADAGDGSDPDDGDGGDGNDGSTDSTDDSDDDSSSRDGGSSSGGSSGGSSSTATATPSTETADPTDGTATPAADGSTVDSTPEGPDGDEEPPGAATGTDDGVAGTDATATVGDDDPATPEPATSTRFDGLGVIATLVALVVLSLALVVRRRQSR
ncbi:right-handed parallel beta-helix repeat-containing protein [Salinigranum sp. GCM10025319]|uniref:right-handed parallel beta-helix repeat-containing protein n=1 Tax=Salinigranum sp. GCM10025319 TaxID=3252687 RepID=UPI003606B6ED